MKKEEIKLLIGFVGTIMFFVLGALAYWLISGNAGKTLWVIFLIFGLLFAVYLLAILDDKSPPSDSGSFPGFTW